MKHLKKIIWLIAPILIVLLVWGGSIAAQDEEPTPDGSFARIAELFRRDKQATWDLTAVSATPCVGGTAAGYECDNIDLLAFMPLSSIGGGNGNDIWGWTDPQDGKEYALMGRTTGTAFVDISDPENPVYLGDLPTHTTSSTWRDIKVYANHAFIVSEASGHGIQVFDLTRLRNVPSPPTAFTEDGHFSGFGRAHNIVINEDTGFAYGVGTDTCSAGLHIVNIQNPTSPTDAGCFSQDGYTHDAQCVIYSGPDAEHAGKEICFNSNEDTLTIADVTNKGATVQLSRTAYPGAAYAHQGWVTEDQVYFLMDDELDEQNSGHNTRTRVWDVSDLDAPVLIGYQDGQTAAIDHNLYTHNGYAYQSNYRAGLRILDMTDVATAVLPEVAYFDIYPSSDSAAFNGNWSNYPYFDSGVVIVSGIEQGLYILQPTLAPDFTLDITAVSTNICAPDSTTEPVVLTAKTGYTGTVSLSASGAPAGTTVTLTPATVTPDGSSTMSITVSGTAVGTYPITVLGDDGVISHTDTIDLIVSDGIPAAPSPIAPANGAMDESLTPAFSWTAVSGAASYYLEVDDDPAFGSVDYSVTVAATSHTAPALNISTTYYWRVTAQNSCGTGAVSAVFSFTTQSGALVCNGDVVQFSDGIPASFSTSNSGNVYWSTTNDTSACDNGGNNTNGTGYAACADSDETNSGGGSYDAQLWTNAFDLSAATEATLTFEAAYDDYSGGDYYKVDVSTNGGSSWTNHMNWNSDRTELVTIDMASYLGEASVLVRYHYYGTGWDWWAQVDDIALACTIVDNTPIAVADVYTATEDITLNEPAPGVLDNDTDPEPPTSLTAVLDTDVNNGILALAADGSFTYTPTANFCGTDGFTYHANNGIGNSAVTAVTINVTCVNDVPIAMADVYTTTEDITLNEPAPGVLDNDTDPDLPSSLTAVLDADVNDGTLTLATDGSFTYIPTPDFCGTDGFTYHANNGTGDSAVTAVTINVVCVPIAVADVYTATEDITLNEPAPGVLDNDTDPEPPSSLTAVLDTDVNNGILALAADGSFTYTPTANFCGADGFTYHANNGIGNSAVTAVTINVTCVNDVPIAMADAYTATQNVLLTIPAAGVLENDTDVEMDSLTAVLDTDVSDGTLLLAADGSFTYTSAADFCGTDGFSYHANDGSDDSAIAAVTINVTCQTVIYLPAIMRP